MIRILSVIFFFSITHFSIAQTLSLSELKGVWVNNLNKNNFYVFFSDSLASLGVGSDNKLNIYFSRVGFIDKNDPYILHLDSLQNKVENNDVPLHMRVNLNDDDITHINVVKIMTDSSMFYDGGLSALGVSETPIKQGVTMEIINSNVHSYTKVSDLPPLIISKLLQKYHNKNSDYLKTLLGKSFKNIILPKVFFFNDSGKETKIYVIKGDKVEILGEKEEWLKVRYYGKRSIEGWIRKSDVEIN